jgi:hypothetical protein
MYPPYFNVSESNKQFIGTMTLCTASVVYWSDFLAADPNVPRSIRGPTGFSETGTGSIQPREDN